MKTVGDDSKESPDMNTAATDQEQESKINEQSNEKTSNEIKSDVDTEKQIKSTEKIMPIVDVEENENAVANEDIMSVNENILEGQKSETISEANVDLAVKEADKTEDSKSGVSETEKLSTQNVDPTIEEVSMKDRVTAEEPIYNVIDKEESKSGYSSEPVTRVNSNVDDILMNKKSVSEKDFSEPSHAEEEPSIKASSVKDSLELEMPTYTEKLAVKEDPAEE